MATYHVQRTNEAASPPRFEWLDKKPEWRAGPGGEPELLLVWTADRTKARDFGRAQAGEWAEQIEGASLVRFGDAEPDEGRDFAAEERARKAAAREDAANRMTRAEREALGIVTQKDRDEDAAAAMAHAAAATRAAKPAAAPKGRER